MGFFKERWNDIRDTGRKIEDEVKDVGRKIDDEITQPVVKTIEAIASDPKSLALIALMFVPGMQGVIASIGASLAPTATAATQAIIGKAMVSGTMAEVQGGDFLKGAALSVAGSYIVPGVENTIAEALGNSDAAKIFASSMTGGTISEATGGDFTSGAFLSGTGKAIDLAKLNLASDYLDSIPGGQGPYTDDLPDMSDFAELNPASFQIGDTTFAPDYSMWRGTSGAPGLSVAPINTQIQVGSFDYSVGDLLDGLGLKMPNTPSLGSMGGGQGIILKTNGGYITDSGFVPDSYVASLGDPESFINKPVVDVQLSLDELQGSSELDISNKLSGLNVAKFLTPYALAALTKKVYDQSRDDNASGFAMVPIPGDWKSPKYDQTFTPSAPIDFGNAGMLAGTQFANQPAAATPSFYNLSDVINTLNFDSVPFVQQQLQMPQQSFDVPDILQQFQTPNNIGMNDTIGNLDGSPATLNSIIAGIQSQYG